MLKAALSEYNKSKNIAVVSSYPGLKDWELSSVSGVATYTFHMLPALKEVLGLDSRKVVVLCEQLGKGGQEFAVRGNSLIVRNWKRKSPNVFRQISRALSKLDKVDRVLFHFEFNMYADIFTTSTLPFYLAYLKVFKKKNITLLLHQVVENLDELEGHLNMKKRSFKSRFFGLALHWYYRMLAFSVSKVIVHDEILKRRLERITKHSVPIFVVPHGLGEYQNVCDTIEARQELGLSESDFVVLCFGFLTWYKGSDWIMKQFTDFYNKTKDTSVKLIMAGGKSPTLKGKAHYDKYFEGLVSAASSCPNIQVTGFVPEEKVHLYYCAANMVVLPYRAQMSASGPFSIALSFGRPFLLSENLAGVLDTHDVKAVMKEFDLEEKDLLFKLNDKDLFEKIGELLADKKMVRKLSSFSTALSSERDWSRVVREFLMVIDA